MKNVLRSGADVRIMSSNIWGNCKKECPIADRDDNLAVIYHRYLPDVIGMQECSPKSRAESPNIMDLVSDLYAEVEVTPTNEHHNNYTPIVYLKNKYTVLDKGWHYYSGLNDVGSKSVTWAVLENKTDLSRFIIVNTHYYWTSDDAGRAARIENSREILALYEWLREKYPYPAFFTGDFNCRTSEPPIQALLAAGLQEARDAASENSPYRSHHAYPTYDPESGTYNTPITPNFEKELSIDHIFTHGAARALAYEVIVDEEALLASDHCPIFIDAAL